jgi:hypothetical protein
MMQDCSDCKNLQQDGRIIHCHKGIPVFFNRTIPTPLEKCLLFDYSAKKAVRRKLEKL